ncbi:LysR substrate-binding domain-containing protein [Pseudactinotalea sp. Z1739]|uniref:LysR substrate-binding domain-containing protein n=1 Tax=Pseudactinotalea sp. Z1739 TaxID=3413028 RepID=UPI003C7B60AB
MDWDPRLLLSFLTVADELHFGRAATRLRLSQPALSRHIKELERRVGTPLLTRTTRSVSLTGAGSALQRDLPPLLGGLENALMHAHRIGRGEEGHLSVGFIGSAVESVLVGALERIRLSHPGLAFTLTERAWVSQTEGLEGGQDDVAIVRDLRGGSPWESILLRTETICLVMRNDHPFAQQSEVTTSDLAGLASTNFISNSAWMAHHCSDWPFRPRVIDDVTSSHGILALVRTNQGISFMPASYAPWATGDLSFVPVEGQVSRQQVAWDAKRTNSARQIILSAIHAHCASAP